MKNVALNGFISGAFFLGSIAVALFFLRFWKKSREGLFALLSLAFLLLGMERATLLLVPPQHDGRHWVYLVRLLAFALIITGILKQNWPAKGSRSGPR